MDPKPGMLVKADWPEAMAKNTGSRTGRAMIEAVDWDSCIVSVQWRDFHDRLQCCNLEIDYPFKPGL